MRNAANILRRLFDARLRVLAGVVLAAITLNILGSAEAVAGVTVSTYDTAAYVYDVPEPWSSQSATTTYVLGSPSGPGEVSWASPVFVACNVVAAKSGENLLWTSWQNYPKVTQGGREYAQIGDRLWTQHAVDRMQPSGLGAPAGATGAGRSISPNFVEDVLGSAKGVPVKGPNGELRLLFTSGTVQVITENDTVITVITR